MRNVNLLKSRTAAVVTGAVVVVGLGTTGATAAGLINSDDIRNNSIQAEDIRRNAIGGAELDNGVVGSRHLAENAVGLRDLRPFAQNQLDNSDEVNGLKQRVEALEAQVAALAAAEEQNGTANTNWIANAGSTIVDATTARLSGPAPTSVEIDNLDIPVQAGDEVSFTYKMSDESTAVAGGPRVFVETQGVYTNSWDNAQGIRPAPGGVGVANADGSYTVTFEVPSNGRIGQAGVVYDNGRELTATVSNLTIDGNAVSFN